jgi:hypothetical protein
MTHVNVLALFGTSITVDIGDIQPDEALYNNDDFGWAEFDDTLTRYLDSLSEEELRELYRGPESITIDDPVFEDTGEVDVAMDNTGELPDYLQEVVDEALQYHRDTGYAPSEVAQEVASGKDHIISDQHGERANLEVLQDLRDVGCLCTDGLDVYQRGAISYDPHDATIEAIVRRSLEELLHEVLSGLESEVQP